MFFELTPAIIVAEVVIVAIIAVIYVVAIRRELKR